MSQCHDSPEPIDSDQASLGLILQILQVLEPERGKVEEIHTAFHRYQTIATVLPAASRVAAISTVNAFDPCIFGHHVGMGVDSEALVCNAGHGARCLVLLAMYGLARVQGLRAKGAMRY